MNEWDDFMNPKRTKEYAQMCDYLKEKRNDLKHRSNLAD